MHNKAAIAHAAFAFGAGQCIFFVGFGVQKNREVAPHGHKALDRHLLWCGAYDHPVPVMNFPPQQAVAYCAADYKYLKISHHIRPGPAVARQGRYSVGNSLAACR